MSDPSAAGAIPPEQIQSARQGSPAALGQVLEACRPYLLHVANEEFPPDLGPKAGASDLVQQTFMEAHADFVRFHGATEAELLAWLRRILLNNVANFVRQFRTEKRQAGREEGQQPSRSIASGPADTSDSPSAKAIKREDLEKLRQAVNRLPEDYRRVILWRQQDRLTFEEIGQRMNRSPAAVRKLWARGIERLREELGAPHDG